MTYTKQPLWRTSFENEENLWETEAEENLADGTIADGTIADETIADETIVDETILQVLAVCDSLNNLHEKLSRLEYVLKRKNIELGLIQKRQEGFM